MTPELTRATIKAGPTRRHRQGVVAFVEFVNGYCSDTPDILKYMRGWSRAKIEEYCIGRGWAFETLVET